ncbi:MAG TPA: PHB depolymerase family esterase, partial [Thermoanaerobaculia bacterium]|nr:PHB depolymerase family esterase [Thermoanaerobaculia bacterium]
AALSAACATEVRDASDPREGRLRARPSTTAKGGREGLQPLRLSAGERDGWLYVPRRDKSQRAPLLVLLHGATGAGEWILKRMTEHADRTGTIVIAPDSRDVTWDLMQQHVGPDVAFIDRALASVFAHHAIDPMRIAIGGFSDGASYALTLGLINGDLFTHILAFSAGYFVADRRRENRASFSRTARMMRSCPSSAAAA